MCWWGVNGAASEKPGDGGSVEAQRCMEETATYSCLTSCFIIESENQNGPGNWKLLFLTWFSPVLEVWLLTGSKRTCFKEEREQGVDGHVELDIWAHCGNIPTLPSPLPSLDPLCPPPGKLIHSLHTLTTLLSTFFFFLKPQPKVSAPSQHKGKFTIHLAFAAHLPSITLSVPRLSR